MLLLFNEIITSVINRKQALIETFSDYFTHPFPTIYYLIIHEKH